MSDQHRWATTTRHTSRIFLIRITSSTSLVCAGRHCAARLQNCNNKTYAICRFSINSWISHWETQPKQSTQQKFRKSIYPFGYLLHCSGSHSPNSMINMILYFVKNEISLQQRVKLPKVITTYLYIIYILYETVLVGHIPLDINQNNTPSFSGYCIYIFVQCSPLFLSCMQYDVQIFTFPK